MPKTLYLLDGMALVYRAHFAFIKNPIFTARGENTSALYGFTNTLFDLIETEKPDFLAIALDTPEPTARHRKFPAYKAQRDEIPEDIAAALPHLDTLAAALRIPLLKAPGFEADDIIGTLALRFAPAGVDVCMVTPDKDFAQLVRPGVSILKPGRAGGPPERLGPAEVMTHWEVNDPARVADVLGLWGDASDNIPGIPGFGEKTAKKLISTYGSIEGIYAHLDEIKGKQRERLEAHHDQALLCRDLATIDTHVPLDLDLEALRYGPHDDEALKELLVRFEFNAIGRRLYGDTFKAGRGHGPASASTPAAPRPTRAPVTNPDQGELFAFDPAPAPSSAPADTAGGAALRTLADLPHDYRTAATDEEIDALVALLRAAPAFCFDIETDRLNPKFARVAGLAFSTTTGTGWYVPLTSDETTAAARLARLAPALTDPAVLKVGQNLKFDLSVLTWRGVAVAGPFFDTMIAHTLLEPDRRHGMDALAEQYLGYTPIPITALIGEKGASTRTMFDVPVEQVAEYAAEDADITWQLYERFAPMVLEAGLDGVLRDIEMPLIPVLIGMEHRGIRLDPSALSAASRELADQLARLEEQIYEHAGGPFNINSPKQLGEILFDRMGLGGKPKKTRTGQYATDESVLSDLVGQHPIAALLLEYREAAKLKSTYVDSLPEAVFAPTGRIHTTYASTGAITGRLASTNPNLQNIPIRTDMGRQIRAAFVPDQPGHLLMAADYSQIELRIMAALSGDPALGEAFAAGLDIHAATAARVFNVPLDAVTSDMRRKAKMVNFGIIYGISAFGLAQRLGVSRSEAAALIDGYFTQYPGVKTFMEQTIADCRQRGYVETLSGRRRWIRDIASANATVRGAAERTAINTPIQGTAADMIKLAMITIADRLPASGLTARMLLQVHDELVFELPPEEREPLAALVGDAMRNALPLSVPVVVETGFGANWLEAH
jgi:DNA polymerase-1